MKCGNKTIVVRVERRFSHKLLGKTIRRTKRYHAHDECGVASVGDLVRIQECPPKSKLKRWILVSESLNGDGQGDIR